MFSITLKRSAATLGVVAGLLAAAGPASAAGLGSVSGEEMTKAILSVKTPGPSANVPAPETANGFGLSFEHIDFVQAPTDAGSRRVVELPEEADAQRVHDRVIGTSAGTQIGIED